jgi:hypothetical protein
LKKQKKRTNMKEIDNQINNMNNIHMRGK